MREMIWVGPDARRYRVLLLREPFEQDYPDGHAHAGEGGAAGQEVEVAPDERAGIALAALKQGDFRLLAATVSGNRVGLARRKRGGSG